MHMFETIAKIAAAVVLVVGGLVFAVWFENHGERDDKSSKAETRNADNEINKRD